MSQYTRRLCYIFSLLALLLVSALAGCSSTATSAPPQATATRAAGTPTTPPGGIPTPGGTASPTIAGAACGGQLGDVILPANAVQVGSTETTGATITCAYRIPQDVQTLDTFFKTQMKKSGWTLLKDNPEGPQALVQEYFHAQRFATLTLSQHDSDAHTTDVTVTVESSK